MLIFLHGLVTPHSGNHPGDEYERTRGAIACLLTPAFGYLQPLIVAPRSPTGQWWGRSDTEFVLGLVLALRERWPAAGARSVILGYSNGGIGSWYFARLYPEYFVAAIPMAFSATIVGDTPLPVYAIMGTKDEQFEFEPVRAAVAAQIRQGHDVTLNQKYRGSHYAPCSYEPELVSAAHWLETHVFRSNGG
jgi:pimeloyl-ACP methyl ester carboxylesterase